MPTKKQQLEKKLERLINPEKHGDWFIEYRPGVGWFAVSDSPRHFADNGEFLGDVFEVAMKSLEQLF